MPTANTEIPTDRAERYLAQLCGHLGQMNRMRHRPAAGRNDQAPPAVVDVHTSTTTGTIRFSHGTCTLQATPDKLTVRVDADDEDALNQLQQGFARRLETIGRRDGLTLHWHRPEPAPGPTTSDPAGPGAGGPGDGAELEVPEATGREHGTDRLHR